MNSDLIEKLTLSANAGIEIFLNSALGSVMAWLNPLSTSLLILYLAFWGYQHLMGRAQETLLEGFWRVIFIGIIISFSLNLAFYNEHVRALFIGGKEELTVLFSGTSLFGGNPIDAFFNAGFSLGKQLWDQGGVTQIGYWIMATFVWFFVAIFTAISVFLTLLSSIATALLIAIGPIVIMLLLFNATKQFFQTWLSQLFNYALIAVFTSMMLNILLSFIMAYITAAKAGGADPIIASVSTVVLLALSTLVLSQVPGIASGLAGGIALSTMGAISHGVAKVSGQGRWLAGNLRPTTARKRLYRLKRDARIVRENISSAKRFVSKPFRAKEAAAKS